MDELMVRVRHPETGVLHTLVLPGEVRAGQAAEIVVEQLGLPPKDAAGATIGYWLADEVDAAVLGANVPLRLHPPGHALRIGSGSPNTLRVAPQAPAAPAWTPPDVPAPPPPRAPFESAAPRPRPAPRPAGATSGTTVQFSIPVVVVLVGAVLMFVAFFALPGREIDTRAASDSESVLDFISSLNDAADEGQGDNLRWGNVWYGIPVVAGAIVLVLLLGLPRARVTPPLFVGVFLLAALAIALNFVGWVAAVAAEDGGGDYFWRPINGYWEKDQVTTPAFPTVTIGAVIVIVGAVGGLSRQNRPV
ncbi:MAG: hypothetical protein IT304_11770 [Dehalococcoidia bacterium]|nr:hypothetical protein [Dehalococcoidia bacterium]